MQHLVRKSLGWSVLVVVLIALIGAWPTRDHELSVRLSRVAEEKPIELYDESLFCTLLPDCFRIANKVFVAGSRVVISGVVDVFNSFPGNSVTDVPSWAPQYAMNLGPYLLLRIVLIVAIALALHGYFRRWVTVGLVSVVMLCWSTGVPIRAAAAAYGYLIFSSGGNYYGFREVQQMYFSINSNVFLLEYDYLALAVLLMFPMWLHKGILGKGKLAPIAFGLTLAMTFEHLAVVYIVALLWVSRKHALFYSIRRASWIALGWGSFILAMIVYSRLSNPEVGTPLVKIAQYYYMANRYGDNEWMIVRYVFGFLGIPYLIGNVVGFVLGKCGLLSAAFRNIRPYIHAVVIGLCVGYTVGFFNSGLISEFGRQTIAGQILLLISGMLRFVPSERKPSSNAAVVVH